MITIQRLGAESYMYVDIGQEEPRVVKAEAAVPAKHGERARIAIPAATYLFAADGTCVERKAFHELRASDPSSIEINTKCSRLMNRTDLGAR